VTQKLILIRGAPGSGKSYLARRLLAPGRAIIEADMLFETEDGYHFDPRRLGEAHAWCQANATQLMFTGATPIVANTFTKLWELEPYIAVATGLNISIEVHHCTAQYPNEHGVPEAAVQRMIQEYEPSSWELPS
jgi:predicted kinase